MWGVASELQLIGFWSKYLMQKQVLLIFLQSKFCHKQWLVTKRKGEIFYSVTKISDVIFDVNSLIICFCSLSFPFEGQKEKNLIGRINSLLSLKKSNNDKYLAESFYNVNYGLSIITSKSSFKNFSNQNKHWWWYYKNCSIWHFNSCFVLKTTKTQVFVFITEIFLRFFLRNNWWSIIDVVERLCYCHVHIRYQVTYFVTE
jgi:hypothetical protein